MSTTTQVPPIERPSAGFRWTDELRAALPVVRGIHAPPLPDGRELLATPIIFDEKDGHSTYVFDRLAEAYGRPWTLWDAKRAAQMLVGRRMARADLESWTELGAQCACARLELEPAQRPDFRGFGLRWMTLVGLALHGLPFMLQLGLDLWRAAQRTGDWYSEIPAHTALLRHAIAAADDVAHAEAIELLERQAGDSPKERLLRAYLCPHKTDWTQACVKEDAAPTYERSLATSVMSVDQAMAYFGDLEPHAAGLRAPLLLQAHLHGNEAFALFAHFVRKPWRGSASAKALLALTLHVEVPPLLDLLAELIDRKEARAALDALAVRFPAAVLEAVTRHALTTRSPLAEGWALRFAGLQPAALARMLPVLAASERDTFRDLLEQQRGHEAPADALPAVLRSPPWLGKARVAELPTIVGKQRTTPDRLAWSPDERKLSAGYEISAWRRKRMSDLEDFLRGPMQLTASGVERVMAGRPLLPGDVTDVGFGDQPEVVLAMPDAAGLALWNSCPGKHWSDHGDHEGAIHAILGQHGEAAIPGFAAYVDARPEAGFAMAQAVDSASLVPTALHALRKLKKAKPFAMAWLRRHTTTALTTALPVAFGKGKAERDDARFGLRWLCANGFEAQAREVAATFGTEMSRALQALLDADPLLLLPARMPELPGFFVPAAVRRPRLVDGDQVLPVDAAAHIGSMLAISKLEAPYAGLAIVKEACTRGSLAEFAWDLFEAWEDDGAPVKGNWAFTALGLLGDDETARRLAPRVRQWPQQEHLPRAMTGLDLLAAIGSDVALMHLQGIADKARKKALQDRAKEKIAEVAQARGLTAAELADRLVPDLGLDERGTLELDFGKRKFHVGFDEMLEPFVKDAHGVRLGALPKPNAKDDSGAAEAATERWKLLEKDAKAIAGIQVTRLEMAMVARRRWPVADLERFFLGHPLMRHLAARLVWGEYGARGELLRAFRVAEDWTLADADDRHTTLADAALVGLVHTLEMPHSLQTAFAQIFADYEIMQPLEQLGRETFTLTATERTAAEIDRHSTRAVTSGSVMGLLSRGWSYGEAQGEGSFATLVKEVGEGLRVDLVLEPGIVAVDVKSEPKQIVTKILLRPTGRRLSGGPAHFGQLDAIVVSEVLRDVARLTPWRGA